ncbi:MAG: AsmA family protein [Lysobacter sp.]
MRRRRLWLGIAGLVLLGLARTPTIRADDLRFGNAVWSKVPTMAEARRLEFSLALKPLFSGDVRIPTLHLIAPRLHLETGPDGGGNWQFGEPGDGDVQFRRVRIDAGQLRFLDAANDTDIQVDVATAEPADARADDVPSAPPITVEGGGRWQGNEFSLQGRAETPMALRDADSPYRIDLQARAGATRAHARGTARADASARVLPDTPYELDKLRAMDADVRLRAQRINAPSLPLDDMDAHLLLENGVLRLDPLNFGVADGDVRSTIRMDARQSPIRTRADIAARGLDLSQLLPKVELAQNAIGKVGGHVQLAGSGNSVAEMLGSSDGEVALGIGRGKISNLLMEMAGIDVAEIIKFKLTEDRPIPIRCAFGDFKVDDGVMTARSLAFDTTDTILIGEGTIDLGEERFDLTIQPRPKDRSLFSFRSPLRVGGTFKAPTFQPDASRIGLRAAIALTLGSIAPPAALLATLELGPGENANCGGQYAK